MKIEQQINNQWRVLHKIFNNEKETFDWDDMRLAIEGLLNLKTHVPLLNMHPEIEEY